MRVFLILPLIALFLLAIGSCQDKEPANPADPDDPITDYWAQFTGNYAAVDTCITFGGVPSPDTTYENSTVTVDSISPNYFRIKSGIFFYGGDSTHNVNSDTAYYHFVYSSYSGAAWLVKDTKQLLLKRVTSNGFRYITCFGVYLHE